MPGCGVVGTTAHGAAVGRHAGDSPAPKRGHSVCRSQRQRRTSPEAAGGPPVGMETIDPKLSCCTADQSDELQCSWS
jgi:hypothetical protein